MRNLYFLLIGILLLVGCQQQVVPTSEVVPLPDALTDMPVGGSVDLGYGFTYTRISDSQAVRSAPVPQQVIRKCKNCGNTTIKDKRETKLKDKSETKDKSKIKEDLKTTVKEKNKTDNSVGKTPAANKLWTGAKAVIAIAVVIIGLVVLSRFL